MVSVPSDPAAAVLERLRALPAGAWLLGALADPLAGPTRDGRRAPALRRPLEGVHVVGGAVRDLLLGGVPREIDLVVEDAGHEVFEELRRRLGGVGRTHESFGTATIETRDGMRVDVARARSERYPLPGALPEVAPGTVADDMARRDFTVNAIAVGVSSDRLGALHVAPRALDDLAERRLRVMHDRSFIDDPTRLLRLVRYAGRLGFAIEPGTEALARRAFAAGAPATAGPARIGRELWLLLGERDPVSGLVLLEDLSGDRALDEDLVVEPEILRAVLALLPSGAEAEPALLAALTRHADRSRRRDLAAGMHVHRAAADVVDDAARDPSGLAAALAGAERPSELWRLLRHRTPAAVALAGAVGDEAARGAAVRWRDELSGVRLQITGADLLAAGVPQGPEVGRRLDAAMARKLDEGLGSREDELAAALDA